MRREHIFLSFLLKKNTWEKTKKGRERSRKGKLKREN